MTFLGAIHTALARQVIDVPIRLIQVQSDSKFMMQGADVAENESHGVTAGVENHSLFWYSAEFTIGTPPQKRDLLIDTGSSWTWTWADECASENRSIGCLWTS